jgi:hypothetical protein
MISEAVFIAMALLWFDASIFDKRPKRAQKFRGFKESIQHVIIIPGQIVIIEGEDW